MADKDNTSEKDKEKVTGWIERAFDDDGTRPISVRFSDDLRPTTGDPKISRDRAREIIMSEILGIDPEQLTYDELDEGNAVKQFFSTPLKAARWMDEAILEGEQDIKGARHGDTSIKLAVDAIVEGLPDEALFESTLYRLDGAQLLTAAINANPSLKSSKEVLDTLASATEVQRGAITSIAATRPGGEQAGVESKLEKKWRENYQGDELIVSPQDLVRQLQGRQEAGVKQEDLVDPDDPTRLFDLEDESQAAVLTQDQVQELFRDNPGPNDPFNAMQPFLNEGYDIQGQVTFESGRPSTQTRRDGSLRPTQGGRKFSVTEAQQVFYNMTRAELKKLQGRLRTAGYFANEDGGNDDPMFEGDPLDNRLRTAWLRLVGDAVRSGTSMVSILDERAAERVATGKFDRKGDAVKKATDIVLTDSMRVREGGDAAALKLIGRTLSEDELPMLIEFIHKLEDRKQREAAGIDENDPNSETFEKYDVDAQIDNYIKLMMPRDLDMSGEIEENEAWTAESLMDYWMEGSMDRPAVRPAAMMPVGGTRGGPARAGLDRDAPMEPGGRRPGLDDPYAGGPTPSRYAWEEPAVGPSRGVQPGQRPPQPRRRQPSRPDVSGPTRGAPNPPRIGGTGASLPGKGGGA